MTRHGLHANSLENCDARASFALLFVSGLRVDYGGLYSAALSTACCYTQALSRLETTSP